MVNPNAFLFYENCFPRNTTFSIKSSLRQFFCNAYAGVSHLFIPAALHDSKRLFLFPFVRTQDSPLQKNFEIS
ncbi:MAG: hypothetical protein A2W17_11385 [Planctomycetes bacterium RBG_16_41_13]|nr:MAG: hypothetical protein A2W17_11385 [Planctomycetes bacterium RBG_16_41_13]